MSCLDLKQNERLCIDIDKGTTGTIVFDLSEIPTMDVAYSLILDPEQDTEQTYTVGSGLTIVDETVEWAYGLELSESRSYIGKFESDSQEQGTYVRLYLQINVST